MKVGILTFHSSYNYGANLQALATQEVLTREGHEAIIINYRDEKKDRAYKLLVSNDQASIHEEFIVKSLKVSVVLRTSVEVQDYCNKNLDAVLVGSDAVFRVTEKYSLRRLVNSLRRKDNYFSKVCSKLDPYWMHWEKRSDLFTASISASSMGTKYWLLDKSLYPKIKSGLVGFDILAARDDWTRKMLASLSGKNISDVMVSPDPVFLLNKAALEKKYSSPSSAKKLILLSGNLPNTWVKRFADLAHEYGYVVGNLPSPENYHLLCGVDEIYDKPLTPQEWYLLIANCAGYVGVRFHPLVICLANSVPAINLANPRKGDFLYYRRCKEFDLCKKAGIQEDHIAISKAIKMGPDVIFERLISKIENNPAEDYSVRAKKELETVISCMLSQARKKIGGE